MNDSRSDSAPAVSQRTDWKRFKTVDGHCYVLEDKLVITHDRKLKLPQALDMSRWHFTRIGVFLISTAFALIFAYIESENGDFYIAAAYLFLALFFAFLSASEALRSKVLKVEFKDIINVQYYGARFGRKNSIFEIVHSKNLRVKYTEIMLPKPKNSGKPNTQKALELMDDLLK